ncbi:hypothetical protein IWQ55_006179 [Labrenzia sp. EL_208]|nr:hypothetical protein [Labrenzia sp. EL_132]MBG6211556.1 hypothetical protein [Labrenzia sp. EL_126]MBG6232945.1 hypothetical protein [Labrenzia sp. EL_208]
MNLVEPLLLSDLISDHKRRISDMGIKVRSSSSFEALEDLLPLDQKSALSEHFRTALNTYTEATGFWLGGFDKSGRMVALCAARLDDLGDENMENYLRRYWHRCYPAACDQRALLAEKQPRFWRNITGRVGYYGDFFLKREGIQGRGLPKLFAPLCVLLGILKWNPDWHYCWVNQRDWSMRYPLAYGFARTYSNGLRWDMPPATIRSDLVAAVNSRSDALDWIEELEGVYLQGLST